MDPSSAHHNHQEMSSQTLESMLACNKTPQDKKPRPPDQTLKCPRCDSTNTKFCYYNNYSLSQPRYFCKSCRRYWTKGGTLRNVPVGGGCRKNKRSSSSSSSKIKSQDPLNPLPSFTGLSSYDAGDLSLAFARLQKQTSGQLGLIEGQDFPIPGTSLNHTSSGFGGFLETPYGIFNNFSYGGLGHVENGGAGAGNVGEDAAFPFEDMSGCSGGTMTTTTTTTVTAVKQENCNGGAREGENKILWGFPWQIGGGDSGTGMGMGSSDIDSAGRGQSWNGFGSTWHGLLNSPLT